MTITFMLAAEYTSHEHASALLCDQQATFWSGGQALFPMQAWSLATRQVPTTIPLRCAQKASFNVAMEGTYMYPTKATNR